MNRASSDEPSQPPGHFFLPGPTEVHAEVLEAQLRPMIGHRGPAIQEIMAELQGGLKAVFRTARPVFVFTCSATGLMEAAVRNGASSRVLSLVNGAFSSRFAETARKCGVEVDEIAVPWGGHHDPEQVRYELLKRPYDAVTVVHSETSTGVLNPLKDIAAVVSEQQDVLLFVDAVTSMGGVEVRPDDWGLDFVFTGSQKALAVPPGLAFAVASERMMRRSASLSGKGIYFDLQAYAANLEKLQTSTTPAVSLLYALRSQLRRIAEETVEARWRRHDEMARRCWSWVEELRAERGVDVSVLAEEGYRSPTVTCVRLPEGTAGPSVVKRMAERGWVIGKGYGSLADTTIRIGHMGDHTPAELDELLEELSAVLG